MSEERSAENDALRRRLSALLDRWRDDLAWYDERGRNIGAGWLREHIEDLEIAIEHPVRAPRWTHEPHCNADCLPGQHMLTSGRTPKHGHDSTLASECATCVLPPAKGDA